MRIEFYWKETGVVITKAQSDDWYFVMSDKVYRDSAETRESQAETVSFEDFVVDCDDIGWRVTSED